MSEIHVTGYQVTASDKTQVTIIDEENARTLFNGIDMKVKPTEYIKFDSNYEAWRFLERVGSHANPDIIISRQIPVPTLEIKLEVDKRKLDITMAFKDPLEIMKLQTKILDGDYIIDPTNLPVIGAVHLKRNYHPSDDMKYTAHIPIIMNYLWDEERFVIYAMDAVRMEGHTIELVMDSFHGLMLGDKYGIVPDSFSSLVNMSYDEITVEVTNAYKIAHNMVGVWYAVQIALLNPICTEYTKTEMVPSQESFTSNKKQKKPPKKKYIKRLYIDADKMDEIGICTEQTKHKYTKPIWWVMGHYRTYKSGKRVFIQGYWKGALRELKNAEPREREIVDE